jgi:fructoselysine-6-P-deglycase FrlB-like protein
MAGRIVTVGDGLDHHVPASLPKWARPALYLLPLQLLALERALAKELDPDSPRHLTAVIHLDVSPETP